jgi:hypothetical protein
MLSGSPLPKIAKGGLPFHVNNRHPGYYAEALNFHLSWRDDEPVIRSQFSNPAVVTFH